MWWCSHQLAVLLTLLGLQVSLSQVEVPGVSCNFQSDGNFLCDAAFPLTGAGVDFSATFFCAANDTLDSSVATLHDYDCRCDSQVTLASGVVLSSCGCGSCPVGSTNLFGIDCGDQVILSVPITPPINCSSFDCDGNCNAPVDIDTGGPLDDPETNMPTASPAPTSEPLPPPDILCTQETADVFSCTAAMGIPDAGTGGADLELAAEFLCLSDNSSLNVLTADCGCQASADTGAGLPITGCACGACPFGNALLFGIDCGTEVITELNGFNCTSLDCSGTCNGFVDVDSGGPTDLPNSTGTTPPGGGTGLQCSSSGNGTFECAGEYSIPAPNGDDPTLTASFDCLGGSLAAGSSYDPVSANCSCVAQVALENSTITSCACGACPLQPGNNLFGIDCGNDTILETAAGELCTALDCTGLCNGDVDIATGGPAGSSSVNPGAPTPSPVSPPGPGPTPAPAPIPTPSPTTSPPVAGAPPPTAPPVAPQPTAPPVAPTPAPDSASPNKPVELTMVVLLFVIVVFQ